MNIFDKLKQLQESVKNVYPEMTLEEFAKIVEFLANNWHGSKRKKVQLTLKQLAVYEILTKEDYNSATVYRWLLLATAPQPIREKVRSGQLSVRQALRERRIQKQSLSITDKEFITAVIRCVEQYISEAGENYPGRIKP